MIDYLGAHCDIVTVDKCLADIKCVVSSPFDYKIKVKIAVERLVDPANDNRYIWSVVPHINVDIILWMIA